MNFEWQRQFDLLKEAGDFFARKPEFALYANYCQLRERGHRKNALDVLNQFVEKLQSSPVENQRAIVAELCSAQQNDPYSHGYESRFIPKSLSDCLLGIVSNWNEENGADAERWLWQILLSGDATVTIKALEIHPRDEKLLLRCIHENRRYLDFQMHHVQDGGFIGSTQDAAENIEYLTELARRIPSEDRRQTILEDIDYSAKLLNAWLTYSQAEEKASFPDWCERKGYVFHFHKSYYYHK